MKKGRIVFIAIVSIIAIGLILFSSKYKGYEKVGRVNEYVIYYDETQDDTSLYGGYLIKVGFYEISFQEAIDQEEINQEYINQIQLLITAYEEQNND